MSIEQVPDIPMFRQNTAGFVYEIPAGVLADVDGNDAHVRVQVLTNAGALDRDSSSRWSQNSPGSLPKPRVTRALPTGRGCSSPRRRTVVKPAWRHTNSELVAAARAEVAGLSAARDVATPSSACTGELTPSPRLGLLAPSLKGLAKLLTNGAGHTDAT
jgi:hypothetical protein